MCILKQVQLESFNCFYIVKYQYIRDIRMKRRGRAKEKRISNWKSLNEVVNKQYVFFQIDQFYHCELM